MTREVRWGVEGVWCDGVFVTEGHLRGARVVGPVRVEISRQNTNLAALRQRVAAAATQQGGNVVIDFRYGQKAHGLLEQVLPLKWDTESWVGEGTVLRVE